MEKRGKIRALWVTMRPYLNFISGFAALAGLSFVPHPEPLRLAVTFVVLFFTYGFGQALTDVFQTDTDALSSPYRPLVRGELTRGTVLAVSLSGLLLSALILALLNPWNLVLGALGVAGLALYTWFKRRWWGGPPWNAWIVALLPIIAFISVSRPPLTPGQWAVEGCYWHFPGMLAVVFFAYANFVLLGYLKDISADRATGYHTFPVVFDWTATVLIGDLMALAAAGLTAAMIVSEGVSFLPSAAIFGIAFVVNLHAQTGAHRTRDEKRVWRPVTFTARAFVLYMSVIITANKPLWIVACLPLYLLFELSLRARPEITQV